MEKTFTLQERADLYHAAFPKFPPLLVWNNRIEGRLWFMGNQYQTSGLYGAYPHGYLPRIMSMFPECEKVLHLFSGSLPKGPYTRFDCRPETGAEVLGEAESFSKHFPQASFDLIYADPPYSLEDAEHYGVTLVKRQTVLKECFKVLRPGGFLCWLDQVFPNYKKIETPLVGTFYCREEFSEMPLVGEIGMVKSTNHRVRAIFIFQKGVANGQA